MLSIQAQPSGRAASDEDLSQRSAINVVAGGALEIMAEETKPSWVKTLGATLSLVLAAFYLFWLLPKIAANPQEAGPLGNFFFVLIYAQLWMITWGYAMRAAVTFYGLPKPRFFIRFKFDIRKSTRGWTVVALMFLSYALTVYGFGIAYIYLSAFYPNSFNKSLSIIDGIYFSVVTAATVGYGDILPNSDTAKVLTAVEIVVSLLYVVLLFSVASSYARDLREKQSEDQS
jgi:hypothetical protein